MPQILTPTDFDQTDPEHLFAAAIHCLDHGEHETQKKLLAKLLGLKPDHADGHNCLGQLLLSQGDWGAGWREAEWDTGSVFPGAPIPNFGTPEWNGMSLTGHDVLILADRGFGDIFQFCRFARVVRARCRSVILACDPDIGPFLSRIAGVDKVITSWDKVPRHAAYLRLSHVPMVLGIDETAIPTEPYIHPLPGEVATWQSLLSYQRKPLRVGLCWAGSSVHPGRHNRVLAERAFAPIMAVPGIDFVSLMERPELYDWDQTAAVIANCDLVITVDTAVAHLAGAMGKPVWIMLGKPTCWRWLLDRSDSPWYPTAKLYRCPTGDDYAPVVASVAADLERWVDEG